MVCALLMTLGMVIMSFQGHPLTEYKPPRSISVFKDLFLQLQPSAVISLGVLLLILLPVLRVALTVILFLRERDWVYVAITSFVLAVLLFGLFTGQ